MMTGERARPNYFLIWVWLVVLAIVSVLFTLVLPRSAAIFLIFAVAWVKAVLVALNYMHLKYEKWQLYALAIVPLLLVVGLTFALFPDIVFGHGGFLAGRAP
jgi:caa(3)-type oxidase subunit IV